MEQLKQLPDDNTGAELIGDDNASVFATSSKIIAMKLRKIASVKAKKHSSLSACVGKLVNIRPTDKMGIQRCHHVNSARL